MKKLLLILLTIPNLSLAEAISFRCSFASVCSWQDGCAEAEFAFEIRIEYDSRTGTAFLAGDNGVTELIATKGYDGISFLELLQTGAVQSTTIALDRSAVHSRNSIIVGNVFASQFYGNCLVEGN